MKMAEIVKMIRSRQDEAGLSIEKYANRIGITGAALWRYYETDREMNLKVIRAMGKFYQQQGDQEMINALKEYAVFGGDNGSSSQN